jgi:molybdopterin-containing oxidoreductase family iron-sulfur binding subunit
MPPVSRDIAALRGLLARTGGQASWQALEKVAETAEFRDWVTATHPSIGPMLAGTGRRRMLQIMAASFAFGGLAAPKAARAAGYEHIVPYVNQPTGLTPTVPLSYASATLVDGIANGVLVTTIDGRPIKIEGNPDHPWSRGSTDGFGQASVLALYDPDRSQAVRALHDISDWDTFRAAMRGKLSGKVRLLTGPVSSPSLIAQIERMKKALPSLHWHSLTSRDAPYEGAAQAFGKPLETRWAFDQAEVIVSLDGDFLDPGPHQAGCARAWAEARRTTSATGKLLTMHAVSPLPSLTAAKADYRATVAQRDLLPLAQALLAEVGGGSATGPLTEWRRRAAAALSAARGRGIVLTGACQSPDLHAVVHRINAALGNTGASVLHTDPVVAQAEPFSGLIDAMRSGEVETLIMLDCNPVYSAPGDADFAELLQKVGLKIHAGLHVDETAIRCDWHLPLSHPLESWGDARSLDGTATLIQPTIQPLYDGRSAIEIVSLLIDPSPAAGVDLLRGVWQSKTDWHQALLAGFVAGSAFPAQDVKPSPASATHAPAETGLEVLFRPDPTIWDGTFANNAWLQELPKPITRTVWENVVTLSPKRAADLKVVNSDIVTVSVGPDSLSGPVWIMPNQHDDAIGLQLGYGRRTVGSVGAGIGYDAAKLRRMGALWARARATLRRGDGSHTVATVQQLDTEDGQTYVRVQPIGGKPVGDSLAFTQPTLHPREKTDGRAWGMSIDLDSCIGCNACVVACQAENNVPVVGREQVLQGRDMHWLRVDRYHTGDDTRFMPVPCMQCETAPCELGCPVEATVHDHEGLNLMVYNRCIGTRACSAYCPYKVRHFNYLDYTDTAPVEQLQRNPNVTVRARGVMEKCTYCVQRIVAARIDADKQDRPIRDGEVVTACAAACPTQAITFGDLADTNSKAAAARKDPRNYALLGELNTRPRTTYLAVLAPSDRKA